MRFYDYIYFLLSLKKWSSFLLRWIELNNYNIINIVKKIQLLIEKKK